MILIYIVAAIYLFARRFIDEKSSKLLIDNVNKKGNFYLISFIQNYQPKQIILDLEKKVLKASNIIFFVLIFVLVLIPTIIVFPLFQVIFLSSIVGFIFAFSIRWVTAHKRLITSVLWKSHFILYLLSPAILYLVEIYTGVPVMSRIYEESKIFNGFDFDLLTQTIIVTGISVFMFLIVPYILFWVISVPIFYGLMVVIVTAHRILGYTYNKLSKNVFDFLLGAYLVLDTIFRIL